MFIIYVLPHLHCLTRLLFLQDIDEMKCYNNVEYMLGRNDYHTTFFAAPIYNTNYNLQQFTLKKTHVNNNRATYALEFPEGRIRRTYDSF